MSTRGMPAACLHSCRGSLTRLARWIMATEPTGINRPAITVCVILATLMQALDTTIANIALPYIQGSVSASQDQINWVLTSYIVAAAIMTPPTGFLASRFGLKRLFLVSVAGFTVASMLCGMAQSLTQIVLFRVLQGSFGAALVPLSQSVLLNIYPKERQGSAMAMWGVAVMAGPVLGPVLGGWLTENYSWRWVFYINVPLGIASIVMTKLYIFDPPYLRTESRKVDYWGIGMLTIGIGALQIVLDKGQQEDWFASTFITILAIVSAVALAALLWHELTTPDPIVDLRVLKERSYAVGVFLMTVVGFVLYGSLVLLPIMLQTVLGYPPLQAGIAVAPRGVGSFFMMPATGVMTGIFDPRKLLSVGLV